MSRRPGCRAGGCFPGRPWAAASGPAAPGPVSLVCGCLGQLCWFCGLLRARALRLYRFARVRSLSSSSAGGVMPKVPEVPGGQEGPPPPGSRGRAGDELERRLLEDSVNRAVSAVQRLEGELRAARAAERRARAQLGDLMGRSALEDDLQDRR